MMIGRLVIGEWRVFTGDDGGRHYEWFPVGVVSDEHRSLLEKYVRYPYTLTPIN